MGLCVRPCVRSIFLKYAISYAVSFTVRFKRVKVVMSNKVQKGLKRFRTIVR